MEFDCLGQNTKSNIKLIVRNELAHCDLTAKQINFINLDNG